MADTISDKLVYLNEVKQQIKQSIIDKGVQVADTDTFRSYATKIGEIQAGGGGAPATKFGVSIDNLLGDVDENGVYTRPQNTIDNPIVFDFSSIKKIDTEQTFSYFGSGIQSYFSVDFSNLEEVVGYKALAHFAILDSTVGIPRFVYVDFSSLKTIGMYGLDRFAYLQSYFRGNADCHIVLSSLESIGYYGMQSAFDGCHQIKHADLSSLKTIEEYGAYGTFNNCSGLSSININALTTLGPNAMTYCFRQTGIVTISFPALTSVDTKSFGTSNTLYAFYRCTNLTEIHFRADMQATIEAMTGYANKWGATNAVIYFDL